MLNLVEGSTAPTEPSLRMRRIMPRLRIGTTSMVLGARGRRGAFSLASLQHPWHLPGVVLPARLVSLLVVTAFAFALPVGCDDGGDDGAGSPAGLGASEDAGLEAYDAAVSCPDWTHELSYGENGLLADVEGDGEARVRLIHASNVPARKGFNTWTIEIQDSDGQRLDDYQVTWICSFMPEHNHTAGPELTAGDEPGQFVIERLNLGMNGGWEIPIWVDPVDAGKPPYSRMAVEDACKVVGDQARPADVVFRTCVPRR